MTNLEDEKMNPMQVLMGLGGMLLVVVLFCIVVWKVTHADRTANVVINQTQENITDVVEGLPLEDVKSSDEDGESQENGDILDNSNTDPDFTSVNELVTAKDVTNLRSEPSTSQGQATVVAQLTNGDYATRVGINDATGWSKLDYNGITVYAVSQYLVLKQEENQGREDD